ncbi:non-ribosomal peptide synthetase [Acanthopleuribacter pedis]|uniref:Amino acid adenylation domain-containing protein n=1 Tax=Acanthopleuribacter pedis TaxID=442870 RepID=A0A8J7Q8D7_9BACT|nr:non-ribosomal peptide synthetase [Acanthopleuribacter pedis]MBO1319314.1 amino acid adenylation domain-containing protein [Acanthopleuribacter pedis]
MKLNALYQLVQDGKMEPHDFARHMKRLKNQQPATRVPVALTETYVYNEPFLRDHTIDGKQILVGVTHAALAINAWFQQNPESSAVHLQRLSFTEPIEVGPGQRAEVRIETQAADAGLAMSARYRTRADAPWRRTAQGRLEASSFTAEAVDVAALRAGLSRYPEVTRLYEAGEPVFGVGPSFRVIRELAVGETTALATLALAPGDHSYVLDPLITYSAFTALIPLLQKGLGGAFLPFGIKSLQLVRTEPLQTCYLLVRLVKNSGEMILFDVDLIDAQQRLVARYAGCSIKRLRLPGTRPAVPAPPRPASRPAPPPVQAKGDLATRIGAHIRAKLAAAVGASPRSISFDANLMDGGLASVQLVDLAATLERELGIELDPTLFFEYPNLRELTDYFATQHRAAFTRFLETDADPRTKSEPASSSKSASAAPVAPLPPPDPQPEPLLTVASISTEGETEPTPVRVDDIAVIGMAGRVGGADNLDAFWHNLNEDRDVITEVPTDHWDIDPWYHPEPGVEDRTYCRTGSFISNVHGFDRAFFNLSEREARWMDPQVRLLLQNVHAAAEDAGVVKNLRGSNTGVFAGICFSDYADELAAAGLPISPYSRTAGPEAAANRVSFHFDLKGPSILFNTACSSALFALHAARQALKNGECGMAFVAGANLVLSSQHYRAFSALGSLSKQGRCLSFDEAADGYVPGECVGTLLLKPLAQAIADRDRIHAVIKGSAALHAGYTPSFTAPSVSGQEQVLLQAWADAGIDPATLSYIEAHGTGTKLGDSIEIAALKKAFGRHTNQRGFCRVGTVKTHLGHTEGASGMAGMLKVILQMKHRRLLGMASLRQTSSYLRLDDAPVVLGDTRQPWHTENGPRRAGVSAFGYSGAYAHVVLEEYTPPAETKPVPQAEVPALVVLSAADEAALRVSAKRLHDFIRMNAQAAVPTEPNQANHKTWEAKVMRVLGELLQVDISDIDSDVGLAELGLEPVAFPVLAERLSGFGVTLKPGTFLEQNTPARIAAQLADRAETPRESTPNGLDLHDLAYTLQVGRLELPQRLALVADSLDAVCQRLDDYLAGTNHPNLFHEHTERHQETLALFADDEEMDALVAGWYQRGRYQHLLGLWVRGFALDWSRFHGAAAPRRISLPTYPFRTDPYLHPALANKPAPSPLPPVKAEKPRAAPPVATSAETDWCFEPVDPRVADAGGPEPKQKARQLLRQLVSQHTGLSFDEIPIESGFLEAGLGSRALVALVQAVSHLLATDLSPGLVFEYATLAAFADWLVDQHETRLRALQVRRAGPASAAPNAVESPSNLDPNPAGLPLSEGQSGLWFLQKADPGLSAYNCTLCFRGTIDPSQLETACRLVLQRFPILTTVCGEDQDGRPYQTERPNAPLALHHAPPVSEADLIAKLREQIAQPFDMAQNLFRVTLFPVGDETVVLINIHHLIFDGSSFALLLNSLRQFYIEPAAGRPVAVTPPQRTYADYVLAQQQQLNGAVGQRRRVWWQRQLEAMPPHLELPADRPRSKNRAPVGATRTLRLSEAESRRIRVFAESQAVYLSSFFLSLFKALLHVYSGQNDIIVGMPVNERGPEDQGNIGYYINMVPIRSRALGQLRFSEILKRCQVTLVDSMAGSLPFPTLVRALEVKAADQPPIFQVAYAYQNFATGNRAGTAKGDAPWTLVEGLHQQGGYDLDMQVYDHRDGFAWDLNYNAARFAEETIVRLLGHLRTMLHAVLDNPEQPIARINLLSEAETRLLNRTWNDTARPYTDGDQCMHTLFERQAAATPEATALVFEARTMTYAELEQRSRDLAGHLQERGVGPEVRVGVCLERSFEMVVALLGILRAGGAYVPLDPDYPRNRLTYLVEDAAPALILTVSELAARLPEHTAPLLFLDQVRDTAGNADARSLVCSVRPDNLVYVLYTSGSTGRPKGVMLEHRALVNRILWMQETYGLGHEDRILQKTPFSFDVSGWEFHWPLMVGASLVIAPPEKHKDPVWLCNAVRDRKITVMHFVPSMLKAFLEAEEVGDCTGLRKVFCSGEALEVGLKNRFFERLPGQELHNLYGPTEAAIDVSFHACRAEETSVPIGKPIANSELVVCNRAGLPVPRGVPGELWLGGVGLARGYLNRPELTAERFTAAATGKRFYRTGDLVRRRDDGAIEYLGRIDHQVKIRGMRIELGEIEAALLRREGIHHAVVQVRSIKGEQQLVAFYVAQGNTEQDPNALREALLGDLPSFMVPTVFCALPDMPLSPNGKIDRRALEAVPVTLQSTRAYHAPRNTREHQLVALFGEVLGVEPIGINDDFFELGGHSMTAIRLLSRIEATTGVRLTMSALFQTRQPMLLAALIDQEQAEISAGARLIPLQTKGDAPPLYFVHGLSGQSLNYLPLSRALRDRQPLYGFEPPGLARGEEPCFTVDALAETYVKTIQAHHPAGPIQLGGWSLGGVIAQAVACKLTDKGRQVTRLFLVDSYLAEHFDRYTQLLEERDLPTAHLPNMDCTDEAALCRNMLCEFGLPVNDGESVDEMIGREDPRRVIGMEPEAIRRLLAVRCANHEALRRHRPDQVFNGGTYYFQAAHRNLGHGEAQGAVADAALRDLIQDETRRLWCRYLNPETTQFVLLESNHEGVMQEPVVCEIAAAIRGTAQLTDPR